MSASGNRSRGKNARTAQIREIIRKHRVAVIITAAVLVLALATVIFLLARGGRKAADKTLVDWNFAEGMGDFYTGAYYEGRTVYEIVPEGPDGSNCARITSDQVNDARFMVDVPVLPETYYKVTAKVKTQGVISPNKQAGANISSLYSYEYVGGFTGDNAWTDVTVYGRTSKKQKAATICLRLGFYSCDTSGIAWFDDVKIEQLSKLPAGASAISFERSMLDNAGSKTGSATASQKDIMAQYYDAMKVGLIITIVAFAGFALMYRYGVKRDRERLAGIDNTVTVLVPVEREEEPPEEDELTRDNPLLSEESADAGTDTAPDAETAPAEKPEREFKPFFRTEIVGYKGVNTIAAVIIVLAVGLLVRLIVSVAAPQCSIDVNLFKSWGRHIVDDGIPNFYSKASQYSLDYPPLYMYFLWFNALVAKIFRITDTAAFTLLVKLPSILADIALGWFMYVFTRKKFSKNWTIFAVALWVLNPISILDSAAWGQVDSMLALLCVLMVYFIVKDKYELAALMLGLAIILKPQGFFMLPIIGYALVRKFFKNKSVKNLLLTLRCILIVPGTMALVALPFGVKQEPDFFTWLFNLYVGTAQGYKGATVNSYNFYYVIRQNWTDDSKIFFGKLSYFWFGMIAIVVSCLIAWAIYQFTKKEEPGMPFLISASMVYMVTMFGPRMHERYFFPCAALLLAAVIFSNNKIMLWLYGLLTGVNFLSVLSVMMGLEIGGELNRAGATTDIYGQFYWAAQEPHRRAIAIINLICCLALLVFTVLYAFGWLGADSKKLRIWKTEDEQ
ncbi:MAG: DUF2029 domain-containing protein [Clostridia bacterium]|nr:DUF2029 domain-containing protein [Clostridia bacterium]